MQHRFLLQILLLAQHVSGTTMPIIRSSRVLYSCCCLWYFVLWFSSCWSGVELRDMCPVCRMLHRTHTHTHTHTYIYIYICNKTSIKRNILTIKQNTSGSRSGEGFISKPVEGCDLRGLSESRNPCFQLRTLQPDRE